MSRMTTNMKKYSSIGVAVDMGRVPPISKMPFKLSAIGAALDMGLIPPKNYFKEKLLSISVSTGPASPSNINIQIID